MIQTINKLTGEIYELAVSTPEDIKNSWQLLSETIKACERAKDKLKPLISELVNDKGLYSFSDAQFRVTAVQRQTYDKSVMRDVFDEDAYDLFLIPDKTAIDGYLKENVDTIGEVGNKLRGSMITVGSPYQIIRLERFK